MTKSDKEKKIAAFIADQAVDVTIINVRCHHYEEPLTYLVADPFVFPASGDNVLLDGVECCIQKGCVIDFDRKTQRYDAIVMKEDDMRKLRELHPEGIVL